jgi:hypothetical protein
MVATLALAPHARLKSGWGTPLLVVPLLAAVILGLLFMHVLAMLPQEQAMGHSYAGAAMIAPERGTSMQTAVDHRGHVGETCMSPSPQVVAVIAPAHSPDVSPAVPTLPATGPDPTGGAPDLFSLCVQRR